MQRCADCGHSNRSGVHYCTHCGKPVGVSASSLGGPTTLVATAVLAIGLLAFLTIRPVATQSPTQAVASLPAVQQQGVAIATDTLQDPATRDELSAAEDESQPAPTETRVAVPSESEPPTEIVEGLAALEPPTESVEGSVAPVQASAGLDPTLTWIDDVETPAVELIMPTASPSESPLVLQASPTLADHPPAREAAHALPPRSSPSVHPSTSASLAKRTAVDRRRARGDVSQSRPQAAEPWLARLRAEIEACDGNFIVRTVCAERAKMRRCTSANAWGEVPECPAARPLELATFN